MNRNDFDKRMCRQEWTIYSNKCCEEINRSEKMIHDSILKKLVDKQTTDFNNGAPEEVCIQNFVDIVKRQKELMEKNK